MGKKELLLIVVFSIVGFVGGTFLIKAIKGDNKEKIETEIKTDTLENEPAIDAAGLEHEVTMTGDWECPNHVDFRSKDSGECTICNEILIYDGEEIQTDIQLR